MKSRTRPWSSTKRQATRRASSHEVIAAASQGAANLPSYEPEATMNTLGKRLAHKAQLIPETGYNLVGLDDFEPPGEELYLIAHFATRAEAERAMELRLKENPDERLHVYAHDDA
jgi:hypothetical protein